MARDLEWRKKELSLDEVIAKYPDVPPIWVLKVDVQRRGVVYTKAAKDKIDPEIHQVNQGTIAGFRTTQDYAPESLILRDGSYLITNFDFDNTNPQRDPYVVDVVDDKIVITDQGKVLEEVSYWEKPDFYNKKASNGEPMSKYATARPQRIDISMCHWCHFWDTPGEGCKYCPMAPNFKKRGGTEERYDVKYIAETVKEAFKQKGRFSSIMLTGGSILSGKEILDDELDGYIELLQAIGENFKADRIPSQLISSAFNERQLEKLYNETKLLTYTTDIEVLNKERFEWICAGKANHIGYEEWKRRLYAAVDVFGRGNVSSGVVLGVELAKPGGFTDEEDAYNHVIEQAEEIISHGITLAANVWRTSPGAIFQNQDTPSLEYFIKTYRQFDILSHKYDCNPYTDDYRRCGAHPGMDLLRV
ncbi:MAG: radical SAM protein [Lachnospiraceae bacterium]|nr:radical SAM protein [Lachnospiraceae bacterium]